MGPRTAATTAAVGWRVSTSLAGRVVRCDSLNNDKYCECQRPNSEEVPATPTTGDPPTTGKP